MRAVVLALLICLSVGVGVNSAWSFSIPAQEVRPVNGAFSFPLSAFNDGNARYFMYKHSPNEWVRFFIVKSNDGVVRAAFDACDVCYRAKKGYIQKGTNMVCVNCGLQFRTDKINEIKGGCNPAPLARKVQGDTLSITVQDALSGVKYFN
ncbi:MAG: DUF2318 domain-containing protein [Deltaproteobacteria bacterium]|nr:DUF2318 domain-containing protein [Deltaproteobacteria bacterium]